VSTRFLATRADVLRLSPCSLLHAKGSANAADMLGAEDAERR
jgi:hypothetical protein